MDLSGERSYGENGYVESVENGRFIVQGEKTKETVHIPDYDYDLVAAKKKDR